MHAGCVCGFVHAHVPPTLSGAGHGRSGLLHGCSCRPSYLTSGAIENEAAQAFHGLRPVGIGR